MNTAPMTVSVALFFFCMIVIAPWIIGFVWILPDANRRGKPGAFWVFLTLVFGWIAVLTYVLTRVPRRP
jgi:uncharacterized membrane protein